MLQKFIALWDLWAIIGGLYRVYLGFHIPSPLCKGKERNMIGQKKFQLVFQTVKEKLTSAPILVVPDSTQDFVVCTDAPLEGLGIILKQDGRVIAYESRKLKDHELNYPTHDLELTVVVHVLVRWRHFLLGHRFELHIDHYSLQYIFTQPNLNVG